jgi:two-component system chemotaxis family response regulator WspR
VVLSSKEDAVVKSEAFAAGVDDYLVKLPDRVELIARVRHHSKGYLARLQRDAAYRALDESQQKLLEMNRALQRLSNVDGLTGLCNRATSTSTWRPNGSAPRASSTSSRC